MSELRIPSHHGLVGHAIANDKAVFIDDAYANANDEYKPFLDTGAIATDKTTGYRTRAIMVIPFKNSEGEIMGAYQAINKMTTSQQFSEQDMEYLTLAASPASRWNRRCS